VAIDREQYRAKLQADLPRFLVSRRFATDDKWTKAVADGSVAYLGMFPDAEAELAAVLKHQRVLILGEPGAGKSTISHAIVQHIFGTGYPRTPSLD